MRRLLAALALGLLALPVAAVPASAHDDQTDHYMDWEGPTNPRDQDEVWANMTVKAFARFEDGVKSWDIVIRPAVPGAEPRACHGDVPDGQRDVTFSCPWDTTRAGRDGAGGLSYNGKYTIEVTATNVGGVVDLLGPREPSEPHCLYQVVGEQAPDGRKCGAEGARWREVYVVNPVSIPAGVTRSFDSGRRVAAVTWNPAPEPDVQKYVIQEKVNDGAWTKIGESPGGATSFERPITDPATYRYRVAAVRPEVPQSSFAETEPLEVTAPDLSAPSTTTAGAPADDGGEPGVNIPEPPTTSTTVAGATVSSGPRPFGGGGSSLFSRPSASSFRPPSYSVPQTTPTTADTGYSETLPYKPRTTDTLEQKGELAGGDEPETIRKLIEIPRPRDARSLLIPMAGGLALFVFAMQVTYMARRRAIPVATVEDDFGDWLGL